MSSVDNRMVLDQNVVYLNHSCHSVLHAHRCRYTCHIEHVWANLYRCNTSNTTHVCDKTCNQRIVYDNHTSICLVSKKMLPLTREDSDFLQGIRRKRELEVSDPRRCRRRSFNPPAMFNPVHPSASPPMVSCESNFMDLA